MRTFRKEAVQWPLFVAGLLALSALGACGDDDDVAHGGRGGIGNPGGQSGAGAGDRGGEGGTGGNEPVAGEAGVGNQAGAAGAPAVVDSVESIAGTSFELGAECSVRVLPNTDEGPWAPEPVPCAGWLFHFRKSASGELELLSSVDVLELGALRKDGRRWRLTEAVTLTTRFIEESLTGIVPELTSDALEFEFEDRDGDGTADHVRVAGTGTYEDAEDDYSDVYDAEFSATGAPDTKAPQMSGRTVGAYELAEFLPSEPLDPSSEAVLTVDGEPVALRAELRHGVVERFVAERLLLPGVEGELAVTGKDLAGLPIDAVADVRVAPLPERAPPDFEAATPFDVLREYPYAPDSGETGARGSYAGAEAIEGSQSFLVAPGTRVLLRFARPSGTTRLFMSVRQLYDASLTPVEVRAMVAGGTTIHELELEVTPGADFDPEAPAADSFWDVLEEVELPLDETGDDVLLVVDAPYSEGAASFHAGAWLDAVRFE